MFGLTFIGLVMFVNTIFEKGICLENTKNTNIKVPVIVSVIIVILGRKSNIGEIKYKRLCEICDVCEYNCDCQCYHCHPRTQE